MIHESKSERNAQEERLSKLVKEAEAKFTHHESSLKQAEQIFQEHHRELRELGKGQQAIIEEARQEFSRTANANHVLRGDLERAVVEARF
eukprot:1074689-Lingulodinium_polyedra.AAC.1